MRRRVLQDEAPPAGGSSIWMLASFALILLTFFSALNSMRVPVAPREKRVLQSVADKFRNVREESKPAPVPTAWKEVANQDQMRILIAAFTVLFTDNGALTDAGKAAFQEILPDLIRKRTVVEIASLVPAAGITAETLNGHFLQAEMRAEHVRDFLTGEGMPSFSISVKTSLSSGNEQPFSGQTVLQLRIHPANERSGW